MHIRVADISMDIEFADNGALADRLRVYAAAPAAPAQWQLRSSCAAHIAAPAGELLQTVGRTQLLRLPDGRLCRYTLSPQGTEIVHLARYTPGYAQVELTVAAPTGSSFSAADYEYLYTGFEFSHRLSYLGGAVLHSAAIAYRGEGVLFSAPSGTGKSTHAALWKTCFGDDVVYLNDDKPAIRMTGGTATVYGTPWSGKTALHTNLAVPLRAIVFLRRGEQNHICRASLPEGMLYLSEEMVRPNYDDALGEKLVDIMARLVQTVPIYRLTCNMAPDAALTARDGIFATDV